MTVPNSARLPVGLLLAAALTMWAPLFANPATFVALAVGAWLAAAFRLKGLIGGTAIVLTAVAFTTLTGWRSPGIDRTTTAVQTRADQVADVVDQVEGVITDINPPTLPATPPDDGQTTGDEGNNPVVGAEASTGD